MGMLLAGCSALLAAQLPLLATKLGEVQRSGMGRIDVAPDVSDCRRSRLRGTQILLHEEGLTISRIGLHWNYERRPSSVEIRGHDLTRLDSVLREINRDGPGDLELVVEDGQTVDTVVRLIDTALSTTQWWLPRIWMPEYPVQHMDCCGG